MDANRTCIPDLQALIVGLEGWNDYLRLHAGLVVERALSGSMHFQNTPWPIGFRRGVQRQQTLDRHSFGVERCMHVMSAGEIHGSTRLNEALGYLRIESQLCLLVRHVEVCFDPRNARLAYLKLRDLDRSGQLRIIERAASTCSGRENSFYSQVSLLYGLKLR